MDFKGTFTAMVTPFSGERIDQAGLIAQIQRQLDSGVQGLVFLGTTGESATLTDEEEIEIIQTGVKETKGRALVIVGTGDNATRRVIEKTKRAQALGADAAIIVTPYYNKPTQEGIFRHFEAVAAQVDLPILIYNIQGRTGVNIETSTLLRIAGLPNVVGVKEASGNVAQAGDVVWSVLEKYPSFTVLGGDDALALPMIAVGARGVISVASNLVPGQIVSLINAALENRFDAARIMHHKLLPLFKLLFIEVNPMPIKEAMNLCGFAAGACRLPLCKMRSENRDLLMKLLIQMGLVGIKPSSN